MSSSASDLLKKAWEIYSVVLHYVTYAVVFILGSSGIVYQLRTRLDLGLPDFGLTFLESTIVWGVLATPLYIAGMVALVMALSLFGLFVYLGWLFLSYLPAILGIFVEVWRDQRNGA